MMQIGVYLCAQGKRCMSLAFHLSVYLLNWAQPRNPALPFYSFMVSRMNIAYGGSVITTFTRVSASDSV